MKPLVSIIIPAYNVQSYVGHGIESCCNQTYEKIEIVIVDDGSTDNTLKVIEDYAKEDSRIRAYSENNLGVSAARNFGIDKSVGDYLVFLDSDDWLEPNAIEYLISAIPIKDDCLVSCDRFFARYENGMLKKWVPTNTVQKSFICREDALLAIGSGKYNLQSACYKLFSAKIIKANNLHFCQHIFHGEDGLFVFEYLQFVEHIIYDPERLWVVLERAGSATWPGYDPKMMTSIEAVQRMKATRGLSKRVKTTLEVYTVHRCVDIIRRMADYQTMTISEDLVQIHRIMRKRTKLILHKERSLLRKIRFIEYAYCPLTIIRMLNNIESSLKGLLRGS